MIVSLCEDALSVSVIFLRRYLTVLFNVFICWVCLFSDAIIVNDRRAMSCDISCGGDSIEALLYCGERKHKVRYLCNCRYTSCS